MAARACGVERRAKAGASVVPGVGAGPVGAGEPPERKILMSKGGARLSSLSTSEIQRELGKRHRRVKSLVQGRARLAKQLAALDGEIRRLSDGMGRGGGMTASGAPRKRPKNDMNLVEALSKLLAGKTMSVTEATQKVQDAGYRTSAANFRTIVNQCLINHKKQFRKISRGKYTAA